MTETQKSFVLLDVRTPEEFSEIRVKNSYNIDFLSPDFAQRVSVLDKSTPYKLYCRSGNRSARALSLMQGMGFKDLENLGTVEEASATLKIAMEKA